MRIRVVRLSKGKAQVRAESARKVRGEPEAVITVELRLPPGATRRDARDAALKYLDPA